MSSAILKVYATNAAKLSRLQVQDGQLIFVKDTKKIFLDLNGVRLGYEAIQVFSSDEERLQVLAPVEGFYYVEETNIIWRYNKEWKQITPDYLTPFFFGNREDFPPTGNPKILYLTDDATYKWDSLLNDYLVISNKTEWKEIGE